MSRLIVISNRVSAGGGAQGGLAVALSAALREMGGIWFGWSGEMTEEFSGQINFQRVEGVTTATVDLEEQDIEEYYNGYANRTLWDDLVWVQDYHMFPLGAELRRRGVANRIGFFLHTPWPPRRLLVTLPEAPELVAALLEYDVIGFHTDEWLQSFVEYVEQLGGTIDGHGVLTLGQRTARLVACPIGIDAKEFAAAATRDSAREAYENVRTSLVDRALIVGVDRLDYSKGLEERFLGYERFLTESPEERNGVVLLQIAPPSRGSVESYQRIRNTLEGLAGRINGAHAALDWVPIRYVNQGYPREVLAGVYRASRIGLVTPLRDGMNLVAKEYVAAQDPEDPGVLILSRFAGAAEQMTDAILINPHSAEEMADAIRRALRMPLDERIRRWRSLMDGVLEQDVMWWRKRFTDVLEKVPALAG